MFASFTRRFLESVGESTATEVLFETEKDIESLYEKIKLVLKQREKAIIELRFGLNGEKPKTQKEIAKTMNISRSYVSRIESKAISKLSEEIYE